MPTALSHLTFQPKRSKNEVEGGQKGRRVWGAGGAQSGASVEQLEGEKLCARGRKAVLIRGLIRLP